jgi:hypothetical protein
MDRDDGMEREACASQKLLAPAAVAARMQHSWRTAGHVIKKFSLNSRPQETSE